MGEPLVSRTASCGILPRPDSSETSCAFMERPRITDTIQPAMFRKLAVMDRQDDVQSDPTPRGGVVGTHFASARNTSRSSCMISSATAI